MDLLTDQTNADNIERIADSLDRIGEALDTLAAHLEDGTADKVNR